MGCLDLLLILAARLNIIGPASMQISGSIALVTGAASGIGRAVAFELARRKARRVALVDASSTVHEVAQMIDSEVGQKVAVPFQGDVTDVAFRAGVFGAMRKEFGPVTLCVPAAGITRDRLAVKLDHERHQVRTYPLEEFRLVLEVNLVAPVYWALEVVSGIAETRSGQGLQRWDPAEPLQGAVIFIGSISSLGNKGQIAYAATKAGLAGAAATLRLEAIYHGVRCGIIHPAFVDTPMVRALGEEMIREKVIPHAPLRRLIQPEEIAEAIVFMIQNAAVGGSLWADGGWHPGG